MLELSSDQIPTGSHAYVLVILVFVMVNFILIVLQFYNLLPSKLSFDDWLMADKAFRITTYRKRVIIMAHF